MTAWKARWSKALGREVVCNFPSISAHSSPTDTNLQTHSVRVWLSSDYIAEGVYSIKQTTSQDPQGHLFTTGGDHKELFSAFLSLLTSFFFITPRRGGAKWPSSLYMKAYMIQMLLGIHKPSFFHQQKALNQMTSLIFTCTMILDLGGQKNPKCFYPYFTDEDTEEKSVKATEWNKRALVKMFHFHLKVKLQSFEATCSIKPEHVAFLFG